MAAVLLARQCELGWGSAREAMGVADEGDQKQRKAEDGPEQELFALVGRKEPDDEAVEKDLLIPRDARDHVVGHVAGLAPRAATDEQAPESDSEATRSAGAVERHEVVLGVLAEAVEVKPDMGQQQENDDGKQQAEELVKQREIAERVGDRDGERKSGGAGEGG